MTSIEWTNRTWNPTVGCTRVSPGCDHCYAVRVAHRGLAEQHRGLTINTNHGPDWTGEVRAVPHRLTEPLRWRDPAKVFVDSMSDLFHPEALKLVHAPTGAPFLTEIFAVMAAAERHTFQVLTKRPPVMAAVLRHPMFRLDVNAALLRHAHAVMPGGMTDPSFRWPTNIWCGTTIETDGYAWRADHLRSTPTAVRFLSLEPLLGPLPSVDLEGIDWVIAGGESGPGARPMHPDWVRDIRDRCADADIPFFFKQWGEWVPLHDHREHLDLPPAQRAWRRIDGETMVQVGKRRAGRDLDGRTHDAFPRTPS